MTQPYRALFESVRARLSTDVTAPDRELLGRFVASADGDAFAAIVSRHGPLVLGVGRRVAGAVHCEDVFQATFLTLARQAARIRRPEVLSSWLHGVAYRLAGKSLRAARRRRAVEERHVPVPPKDPLDELTAREFLSVLDEELQRLPAGQRLPLILCCLEGRTQDEAAHLLGWSASALKGRLERGRARLRARLTRRGLDVPAVLGAPLLVTPATVAGQLAEQAIRLALGETALPPAVGPLLSSGSAALARGQAAAIALAAILAGVLGSAAALVSQPQAKPDSPTPASASAPDANRPHTGTDVHGDPLPEGAVARLGTVRFNHGRQITSLHYTPDSKTVVSYGSGFLCRWDASSGRQLSRVASRRPWCDDVTVLSADGKTLSVLSQEPDDRLAVWDVERGEALRTTKLADRSEYSVFRRNALSPDGQLCVVHQPTALRVCDSASGRELWALPHGRDDVRDVTFAGNETVVTATKDHVIHVREARTGKSIREFAHRGPAELLAASADGKLLAVMEHHTSSSDSARGRDAVHVWDLASATRKYSLPAGPGNRYRHMHFSPDGKRLFTEHSGTSYEPVTGVWDMATGARLFELWAAAATAVAVSPDGSRFVAGFTRFELFDGKTGRCLGPEGARHGDASAIAFSPDSRRVLTVGTSSVIEWDATVGRRLHSFDIPLTNGCLVSRFSADGRYVITPEGEFSATNLVIWDTATGRRLHTIWPKATASQSAPAFSPDSAVLAAWVQDKEPVVQLWDVKAGKELRSFPAVKAGWVGEATYSPDGKSLLVAGKQTVGYDLATGGERFSWRLEAVPVKSKVQMIAGGQPVDENDRIPWTTFAFSPDASVAACVLSSGFDRQQIDDRIVLVDARTGRILRRWNDSGKPADWGEKLCFSPDGRLLASTDDLEVHVWEVATGRLIRTVKGHYSPPLQLAFSSDGRLLATGAGDGTALIWDLAPSPATGDSPIAEKEVAGWWADLAADDAARAYAASRRLIEAGAVAVPFLRKHIQPADAAGLQKITELIAALDGDAFTVRENASRQLRALGLAAEPALRAALARGGSAEFRQRLEALVNSVTTGPVRGEPLRMIRAVAVVEHTHTPGARQFLQELADGEPNAWLTAEARSALARLKR